VKSYEIKGGGQDCNGWLMVNNDNSGEIGDKIFCDGG